MVKKSFLHIFGRRSFGMALMHNNQLKSFAAAHWDTSPQCGSRPLAKRYALLN
jgi:hypothetical protein